MPALPNYMTTAASRRPVRALYFEGRELQQLFQHRADLGMGMMGGHCVIIILIILIILIMIMVMIMIIIIVVVVLLLVLLLLFVLLLFPRLFALLVIITVAME